MKDNKNILSPPQRLMGILALGAAVTTLAAVELVPRADQIVNFLRSRTTAAPKLYKPVHYTPRQFAAMPGERQTVKRGDGFYSLVLRTNPNANVSSDGVEADEAAFLQDRLKSTEGRDELWTGDTVCVPRVPHEKPEPPIPPSARCQP